MISLKDALADGTEFVERTVAGIVVEAEKRIKAAKVANDNGPRLTAPASVLAALKRDKFEITWVDDVNKEKAKEKILKGVLGAGEFTLFVAKPGTAKSVLLCDMGLHIAAGKDWCGKKVKQGLVVFFAAERKPLTERRIDAWTKHHGLANKIRVSISKGDQYHMTAGILLLEAKRRLPEFGLTWSAFLIGKCHLQKSRSSELIAIAEGRTTLAEVQAKGRERAARFAAKNKVARSSVSNGQSAHKEWLDRMAKKTVDADSIDLGVIDQFATARMSQRKSGALN